MESKDIIKVGEDLNMVFDGLGLKEKPEVFLVVSEDEFKKIDFGTYFSLNKTSEGFVPSEGEIQYSFKNSIIHIFYVEEEKNRIQADRTTQTKQGGLSFLSRFKIRK